MNPWQQREGNANPMGVQWLTEEQAYNFSIYAKNATAMHLLFFRQGSYQTPSQQFTLDPIENRTGRIWHIRIASTDLAGASYYAYQADGPFAPDQGFRYDPQKLLLDPYAHGVLFPPNYSRHLCSQSGSTMGIAPLGALPPTEPNEYDWSGDKKPRHQHDLIIYEMHVRGFTQSPSSGVDESLRGTYSGVIEKIPYLKELGVTAVELLPVHQYDPEEGNYWGYMTLSFFSPHHAYSQHPETCDQLNEFRDMVKALHQAGIEVILDVVYNHTSESDENGPTYSFRGLDNSTYYLLGQNKGKYLNDSGTGNVFNTADRHVRRLVVESLRFWVEEMHVDGFRFDLASIFTRNRDGSIDLEDPPIISAITSDPAFADIRLIAEAWDISAYQLGMSFPGVTWKQWNGQYRDTLRRWVRGESHQVPDLITRLYGSDDLFPDRLPNVYHAYQSVNFITAHDGFCLYDLVSYNQKRNLANGNNNTDGTNNNLSWNHGWEGDENVPSEILALRKQQIKNFFCLLMVSNGTPMLVMGDEFCKTQGGNNNPYNQDNATSWLDWERREQFPDMFRFFKHMIAFRKNHPSLSRSRFWREDVRWYGVGPNVDYAPHSRSLAFYLDGESENDDDLYVMINSYWEPLDFAIQEGQDGQWLRVVDTAQASPDDIAEQGQEAPISHRQYVVAARSVVILKRTRSPIHD
ncbi:MAG TPA: isoamylase [Marinagarivorans sp.]